MNFKDFLMRCESERARLAPNLLSIAIKEIDPEYQFKHMKHDRVVLVISERDADFWMPAADALSRNSASLLLTTLTTQTFNMLQCMVFGAASVIVDYDCIGGDIHRFIAVNILAFTAMVAGVEFMVLAEKEIEDNRDHAFLRYYSSAVSTIDDFKASLGLDKDKMSKQCDVDEFVLPFEVHNGKISFDPAVQEWIGRPDRIMALIGKITSIANAHSITLLEKHRHYATYKEDENPRVVKITRGDDVLWEEFYEPNQPA